jgi:hypothetical protein
LEAGHQIRCTASSLARGLTGQTPDAMRSSFCCEDGGKLTHCSAKRIAAPHHRTPGAPLCRCGPPHLRSRIHGARRPSAHSPPVHRFPASERRANPYLRGWRPRFRGFADLAQNQIIHSRSHPGAQRRTPLGVVPVSRRSVE